MAMSLQSTRLVRAGADFTSAHSICGRSRAFTSSLRPRSGMCGLRHSRRAGLCTKAGLEAEMAVDESSQIPPPKGVTQPKLKPELAPATFGFVEKAERWNSRACMIGFFALLIVEAITHRGLLDMIGLRTGNGLGFEF